MDNDVMYQTLEQFLFTPFGVADTDQENKLNPKYNLYKNMIQLECYSELEGSYYLHLKIPSESDPGKKYDVVIQFFPVNEAIAKKANLYQYYVNFFSNSPSFVYKYAVIYKLHGYMIDALQEKMDPAYAGKLPEHTNPNMKISYDKSLYFACKWLYEKQMIYLSKPTLKLQRKVPFRTLVDGIAFNKDVVGKTGHEIEVAAKKEAEADTKKAQDIFDGRDYTKDSKNSKVRPLSKKSAVSSTFKEKRLVFKKPNTKKPKKSATLSTRHK